MSTTRRIESRNDRRDGTSHWHVIDTGGSDYVLVQVYDRKGALVHLPGSGPALRQVPPEVYIPCLYESYYPLKVVMVK